MLTLLMIAAQIALVVVLTGGFTPSPIWIGTLPLFVAFRILTVKRTGWKGMALAAALIPEMSYDFFRYGVWLRSAWLAITGAETSW
jgi:hypothetical protein